MADVYEKAIVTNSVSKTYSTPAARVGWVVADEEVLTTFALTATTP